jgi:hypothetical protein
MPGVQVEQENYAIEMSKKQLRRKALWTHYCEERRC